MARDVDLQLIIGAIADEKSADEATKQLIDRVFSKLKDGTIKLPINSELDKSELKKLDDNVKQARKEVVRRYNKLQKEMANPEGFDAFSDKAINELIELGKAYATFNSKASGRSKNSVKAITDVKSALGEVFQLYENNLKLLNSKIENLNLQDKVSRRLSSTRSRRSSKSAEAYDRYLTKQEKHSKRAEGAGKRKELFNELDEARKEKSPYPQRIIRGVATKQTLQETEYSGSYPSGFARQIARSRAEARKRELASLKVEKNKEKAEQHAKDLEEGKVKYKTKRQVIDKKSNGQIDISYKDAEVYNKKPKQYTDEENNELKRDVTTNELAKIIGGLEYRRKDASVQLFKNYMSGAFAFNTAAGKNDWKVIQETLEKTLNRYRGDKGTLGITDGTEKGVFEGHEEAVAAIEEMLDYMDEIIKQSEEQGKISVENARALKELAKIDPKAANKYTDELLGIGQQNTTSSNTVEPNSQLAKEIATMTSATKETHRAIRNSAKETEKVNRSVKIGNTKTAVEFDQSEKIGKENKDINRDTARAVKVDETTGFNTNTKSDELISLVRSILQQLQLITTKQEKSPKQEEQEKTDTSDETKEQDKTTKAERPDYSFEMKAVYSEIESIFEPMKNALVPLKNSTNASVETPKAVSKSEFDKISRKLAEGKEEKVGVDKSNIYASPLRQGFWKKIEGAFERLTGATRRYEEVLRANAEDQDKLAAERIKTYGLNNGRNPNDTGDIAGMRRILQLYRTNKASIEQNPELMQKIQLTKGREVDTTEITKVLNKALSGRQMKNAQNGGGFLKNAFGFMTGGLGYAFMPSLEKSRAQADGLNQVLGNVNKALQSVLINIQTKETELAGMEESGQAMFDKNGYLMPGSSSAAYKTLADLEEEKLVLDSIKADLLANDEIIKKTGGRFPQMVKYLNFTSPVLKENNGILRNINSGLDKNGKALKFQNRLAEILNYTYQLMSRSIGQMIKNWITMANPINLIKKAFSDFGSYDVKWQRTMNVIKINFQRIIKPAMEWIAQQLVNIIGFFDIVSQRIQAAFGQIPISLFDQAGAESEQIRRNLEEAANVSLGFDELHDVGTDQSGANDLMGDIYKPQLSQDWIDMATKLGDTLGGFFKGDLGFGEVCKVILELLGKLLTSIGKAIWGWFKETALGKWITEHWKGILATILTLFLGWKLLKIAGKLLFNALFDKLTKSGISGVFGKVGNWITGFLGKSSFGQGIIQGFTDMLSGEGGLLKSLKFAFTNPSLITQMGGWGQMLGMIFVQALTAAIGGALAIGGITKGFDMVADTKSYNMGIESVGGSDKDKKSDFGGKALATIAGGVGGGILAGALGGSGAGPIGMAIGAISGLLISSLAPAFEEVTVKAKDANNEMQKIEYYEGQVQGATTQVNTFEEQLNLLKQSLDLNTQSVYEQGEKLGISKTRMDELVKAVQDGKFTTDMLTGSEQGLAGSLTDLAQKQEHVTEVSKKLEEAQKKLLKAQTDLSIAQDVEAGNFELAAARIEVAEAQGVYTTEEATSKRIQLYKQGSEEERKNLLQNLTPEQRKKMLEYNATTDKELKELNKLWDESSDEIKSIFTDSIDQDTINKFEQRLNSIDNLMSKHQGFWQGVGDTIAEIFSAGHAVTYTYNHEDAAYQELADKLNSGELSKDKVSDKTLTELRKRKLIAFAVGTNYVPNDGLAYLHQGEAVIPKKYNRPYQPNGISAEERAYMDKMIATMNRLDGTIAQGINVKGEFRQRGNDLVATVEKNKSRQSNTVLNNKVYAR